MPADRTKIYGTLVVVICPTISGFSAAVSEWTEPIIRSHSQQLAAHAQASGRHRFIRACTSHN